MPIIETHNLTKLYGDHKAVDALSVTIDQGRLCGFIGPNGAGKTTTIKMLATLIPPTIGSVHIGGHLLWPSGKRSLVARMLGYVPDQFGVYENMRVWEYLEFFGLAYNIPNEERKQTTESILALTDLYDLGDQFVLSLSRDQQRLAIARVLMHNPQIMLLDEPASGLDPQARIELRELLVELQSMGKTILISSHILTELATMCDDLIIIQSGRLVFNGSPAELRDRVAAGRSYRIRVAKGIEKAASHLKHSEHVSSVEQENGELRVRFKDPFPGEGFASALLQRAGMHLTLYQPEEPNLEEAYMRLLDEVAEEGGE